MSRLIQRKIFHCCGSVLLVSLVLGIFWTTGKALMIPERGHELGQGQSEIYYDDTTELGTLKLVQVIFRHGARTPLYPFPKDPNGAFDYGVVGTGQLTLNGKKQAYELGRYLRRRYDGFLAKSYSIEEIYAQSSDTDRTIMTAQTCLAGLFPGNNSVADRIQPTLEWQPIPVHSLSKRVDNKIAFDAPCKEHSRLMEKYLNSSKIREFDSENEWLYKLASENSGMDITNFKGLEHLTDTLMVEEQNGLTLPSWTDTIYPNQTLASYRLDFTIETATSKMRHLIISPIVTEMVRNMNNHIRKSPLIDTIGNSLDGYHNHTAKMYLFSGHDTTLSAFLNSFDVYDDEPPTYVSSVIMELHQSPADTSDPIDTTSTGSDAPQNLTTLNQNYVIKIFYKKERTDPIRQVNLPACSNPCTLEAFMKNYSQYLMDSVQWNKECAP